MNRFQPQNPDYATAVRASFARQAIMRTMHAELVHVAPGEVDIAMPFDTAFTQQDGFLHAGAVTTLADSACGYAAFTLMPAGARVLSVEFKVNLLTPAVGERLLARARVRRAGRRISVCGCDVFMVREGQEKHSAMMQATMMTVEER